MCVPLRPVPPTKTSRRGSALDRRARSSAAGARPVEALGLDPVERCLVARDRPPAAALIETLAPPLAVGVARRSSPRRRRPACRNRRRGRAKEPVPRTMASRFAPDELVEAHGVQPRGVGEAAVALLSEPRRPSHHSTPVAASEGWWDFCAFETFDDPESRPSRTEWTKRASGKINSRPARGGDREAAHLDQAGLACRGSGPRRSKKSCRLAATTSGRRAVLDPGRSVLEATGGGLERVLVDDLVEPTLLALAAGAPAGSDEGLLADSNAVPPVAPELGQKIGWRRLARYDLGEALRVRMEAALDRDRMQRRMTADQLSHDVRAAAAGAANEDEW